MGNISLVFKNSNYVPDPPIPPTTGWSLESLTTDEFSALTVSNNHLWAGTTNGKVWYYGPNTNFIWTYLPTYDFPSSDFVQHIENFGTFYAGLYGVNSLYNYVGGWNAEPNVNKFSFGMALYETELYLAADGGVWRRDPETNWTFEYDPPSAITAYGIATHGGELYIATGPNAYVYKKDVTDTWSQVGSQIDGDRRAYELLSASDGNLYVANKSSDTGDRIKVHQWDDSSWGKVADITTMRSPTALIEFNNLIYYTGSGPGGHSYVYTLDPGTLIRGQDNSVESFDIPTGEASSARDMAVYKGYIYLVTDNTAASGGRVYIYRAE